MRTAVVLLVPEADALVSEVRLAHDPVALAIGAHVTLLFPFVTAERLDGDVVARLDAQCRGVGVAELCFDRVARFPGIAYLALADPEPVIAMIRGIAAAWPDYPRYEGKFDDIVPHLTVAHGTDEAFAVVERELAPRLPLVARVAFASLVVETADGPWREHARFPLDTG